MKKRFLLSTVLFSTLFMTSCANGYGQQGRGHNNNYQSISASSATSSTTNVNSIGESLAYMYDEERLAKEVYLAIYQRQPVRQLSKIASNSESRHIDAVKDLAQKYGVILPYQRAGSYSHSHIQSLYDQLYAKGVRSKKDALEVGCMVEVTDIEDLDKYINEAQRANAVDVSQAYEFLKKGSYNHYWAFDKGLKQIGVSNGCCSIGQQYCHPEYPKNERGGGRGRGRGQGGGMGGGGWR